jgi:hypothetical protein
VAVKFSNALEKRTGNRAAQSPVRACFFSVAKQPALWPPWASEELLLIILIFILILIIKCGKPFAFGL